MEHAERGGEDDLADLRGDLEADHVQGGRKLRVEVQGEVAEGRQAEQRHFDGVEHLDNRDHDRVVEDAAQADAQEHDGAAEQECVAHADLAHDDRHDAHHGRFAEHLHRVEDAVDGVAGRFGGEERGVVGGEHLLVEHGVERVGEQHEHDEHPQGRHAQHLDHLFE